MKNNPLKKKGTTLFTVKERKKKGAQIRRNTDVTVRKKCLSIDPSLISSNIFYRCGGGDLVVTPFIFQSNIFIFLPREKEGYEGRKKGGEGKRKGVYTRRVDVYSRVVDTKKNVASEKKKENIYYRACVCVLTLCVCIYTHTSFLCAYFVTRVPCGCFQANDVVMADLGAWNGGDKNRRGFLYFLNLNHNCFEVKQRFSLLEFLVEFII